MNRILLLNGPNLNLLGKREVDVYGQFTLNDIETEVNKVAKEKGFEVDCVQSNHEGVLIDEIQVAVGKYAGIIFNPAAYTHTSVALLDAIRSVDVPIIEVHISNIHKRETFRQKSITASACVGQIVGLGLAGYRLAFLALVEEIIPYHNH
ncbi:type II 3-dehydroquinate dehydratase [Cerasibacillus terrae]|uniref:3-dehydroquinate dehydratase n=1 Tax=Cerasibacillus terrae TaxID=2498845 RepID=A0A5C8P2Y1_9BACI|nr:type II 3-dehydroquinate dehydratase [Cerasibacillus terrae]TXL67951.1 type II 3-dehydroquinate dehydratase [Cerasibacillus terrae]